MVESKKPYIWAEEARKLCTMLLCLCKVLEQQKLKYGDRYQSIVVPKG